MLIPILPVLRPAMTLARQAPLALQPSVFTNPAVQYPLADTMQTLFDNGVPVMFFIWLFTTYAIFRR